MDERDSRRRRRPPFTPLGVGDLLGPSTKGGCFMLMRMIPTKTHAGMDYAVGIVLIAAPWIFGFADESSAATWIALVAGIALIAMSAITAYEGGFVSHLISMRTHLIADAALG